MTASIRDRGSKAMRVVLSFLMVVLLIPATIITMPVKEAEAAGPPSTIYGRFTLQSGWYTGNTTVPGGFPGTMTLNDGSLELISFGNNNDGNNSHVSCISPGSANWGDTSNGNNRSGDVTAVHVSDWDDASAGTAWYEITLISPDGQKPDGYGHGIQNLGNAYIKIQYTQPTRPLYVILRSMDPAANYYNQSPDPLGEYNLSTTRYSLYSDRDGQPYSLLTNKMLTDTHYGSATAWFYDVKVGESYWLHETKVGDGFTLNDKWYFIWVSPNEDHWKESLPTTDPGYWAIDAGDMATNSEIWINVYNVPKGRITLDKKSTVPAQTDPSSDYSLQNAVFGVYDTQAHATSGTSTGRLDIITTDSAGVGMSGLLNRGTYYVRETTAPKGFTLDATVYTVSLTSLRAAVKTGDGSSTVKNVPKGRITLKKASTLPAQTNSNPDYSLKDAVFGVYDTQAHATAGGTTGRLTTITTDTAGNGTSADFLDAGTYYVRETTAPKGFTPSSKVYPVTLSGITTQVKDTDGTDTIKNVPKGKVSVKKVSSLSDITDDNANYSLQGAVFGIYDTQAHAISGGTTGRLDTVTTNAQGEGTGSVMLDFGTYYVRELTAPLGYEASEKVYSVKLDNTVVAADDGSGTGVVRNIPLSDPHTALVKKVDSETGELIGGYELPRGSATLAGAEFTVRYWDGYYTTVSAAVASGAPTKTWVFGTDENGEAKLDDPWFKRGDTLYYDSTGLVTIPLGTIVIQETKSPSGYLLYTPSFPNTARIFNIVSGPNGGEVKDMDNGGTLVEQGNEFYLQTEQVSRADLYITKFRSGESGNVLLEGIVFDFYAPGQYDPDTLVVKPAASPAFTLTTDALGQANTEDIYIESNGDGTWKSASRPPGVHGGLPFGSYLAIEKNPPSDVYPFPKQVFVLSEDGRDYSFLLENEEASHWAIRIVKRDAASDKVVPLSAKWQIIDRATGDPVVMTTYYPSLQEWDTFTSDATGWLTLPEKLPVGSYALHEYEAPVGYLINSTDVNFEVTSDARHEWDDPLVVTFKDSVAKGRIQVQKTDAITGAALQSAVYEIRAAEDIKSPEGTLHVSKNTVVGTITTGPDGKGTSGELYIGRYTVKETKAPDGYVLDNQAYPVNVEYIDQDTPISTNTIRLSNTPTTLKIRKTDAGTGEPIAGVGFRLESYIYSEPQFSRVDSQFQVYLQYMSTSNISYYAGSNILTSLGSIEWQRILDGQTPRRVPLQVTRYDSSEGGSYSFVDGYMTVSELGDIFFVVNGSYGNKFDSIMTPVDTQRFEIDSSGEYTLRGLNSQVSPYMYYVLYEEYAPAGYALESSPVAIFFIDPATGLINGTESTLVLDITNDFTKVDISKLDASNDSPLAGATLQLFRVDESTWKPIGDALYEWTSTTDPYRIERLPVGQYILHESSPAPGYATTYDTWYYVTNTADIQNVVIKDAMTSVSISKRDDRTYAMLAGATLQIFKDDGDGQPTGEVLHEWVSTTEAYPITGLPIGEYILREASAPKGYATAADVRFNVIDTPYAQSVTMRDGPTQIDVTKRDIATQAPLAGALLRIYKDDGTGTATGPVLYEWTTTTDAYRIENIPVGDYILREARVPDGYVKATDMPFVVADSAALQSFVMEDDFTKVSVSKRDEKTNAALAGATLKVYPVFEEVTSEHPVYTWTSTTEPHVIERIPQGTYVLRETYTPPGYVTASDVTFIVSAIAETQPVIMNDAITQATFTLRSKYDSEAISGAVLQVFRDDGTGAPTGPALHEWETGKELELIERLPKGDYVLHQKTVTEGFVTAQDVPFAIEDTAMVHRVSMLDGNTTGYFLLEDSWAGGPVGDATLQVYPIHDGTVSEEPSYEWATDEGIWGHSIDFIPTGDYLLREAVTPDGYVTSADVYFSIEEKEEMQHVYMYSKHIKVSFSKLDIDTDEELAGVVLQVFAAQDDPDDTEEPFEGPLDASEPLYEWTTTGEPHLIRYMPTGDYVLHEKSTILGYVTADDVPFTVTETVATQPVTMYDDFTKATFFLRDIATDAHLSDAMLQVYPVQDGIASDEPLYEWTTDDAPHYIERIPAGDYILREAATPDGYVTSADVSFTIEETGIMQPVSMYNDFTKVAFSKLDQDTEEELVGVVLQVFAASKDSLESQAPLYQWATSGEPYLIERMPAGDYVLHEESTIPGYVTAPDLPFSVTETAAIQPVAMYDDFTKATFTLKDLATEKQLPGATLQVYPVQDGIVSEEPLYEWTTDTTAHFIEHIPTGDYILREAATPDGYVTSADVPFTIIEASFTHSVVMVNDFMKVSFSKLDEDTSQELAGVILQVFEAPEEGTEPDESSEPLYQWTTTGKPHLIERMPKGDYILHEHRTIDGYVTAPDVPFSIVETAEVQHVSMQDDFTKATFALKDLATDEQLPGATLQVYPVTDNVVADEPLYEWESYQVPHYIERIPVGEYVLREAATPDGYVTSKDMPFTIEETGAIQPIVMYNDFTKAAFTLRDLATEEQLPGAVLEIYPVKDGVVSDEPLYEWVTDGTDHYIERIPTGDYILREAATPDGYVTSEDIPFTIDETGEIHSVVMANDIMKVAFSKLDADTSQELSGVVLQVFEAQANQPEEPVAVEEEGGPSEGSPEPSEPLYQWTTSGEPYLIERMPAGDYILHEKSAIAGYLTAEDVLFTVEETGAVQPVVMDDDFTKATFSKRDAGTHRELPGAVLQIFVTDGDGSASGDALFEWTTTDTPRYIERIPVGSYVLHEASTPDGSTTADDIPFDIIETSEVQPVVMDDGFTQVVFSLRDIVTSGELSGARLQVLVAPPVTDEQEQDASGDEGLDDIGENAGDDSDDTSAAEDEGPGWTLFGIKSDGPDDETSDDESEAVEPLYEWASTDKPWLIEYIPVGDYILREVSAPGGYVTAEDVPFTVEDTPSLQHVVMENDFMKVAFSKYALEDTVELSGAVLQLFAASPDEDVDATEDVASEGLQDAIEASEEVPEATDEGEDEAPEPLFEWTTTDEPHLLERIEAGDYILHEASPPQGFVSAEDIAVKVVETSDVQRVVMYDDHTKVAVSKISASTSEPLAGAVLQVFVYREPDEPFLDDAETDDTDDTTDITDGDSEWQALDGENESTDDSVDEGVEDDTEADGPGSDGFEEDAATDDVSGDDAQPQILGPLFEWTSTDEPYLIEYLPIGTYVLHEASAPQGYLVSEDMVFTVRDSGEVQSVTLYDEPVQVGFWDRTGVDFPFSVLVIAVLAVVALAGVIDVAFSAHRARRARRGEVGPSGGSDASVEGNCGDRR